MWRILSISSLMFGVSVGLVFTLVVVLTTPKAPLEANVHIDPHDEWVLAVTIYHESRGVRGAQDIGWRTVTGVVFNRLEDRRFPKTIRKVILERDAKKGTCAFSWYCDDLSDSPKNLALFQEIKREARRYLVEYKQGVWKDPTHGAHSYHSVRIPPNEYFRGLQPILVVSFDGRGHIFYSDKKSSG